MVHGLFSPLMPLPIDSRFTWAIFGEKAEERGSVGSQKTYQVSDVLFRMGVRSFESTFLGEVSVDKCLPGSSIGNAGCSRDRAVTPARSSMVLHTILCCFILRHRSMG